jgi:GT2 family glycosyltransferase
LTARIEPVPAEVERPFWSVMIPTYRTQPKLLRAAIESVLDAERGSRQMQIEVVNDDPAADVAALAEEFAPRVAVHTNAENLGAADNFTECVRRATGTWVHILHADDAVRPGFYEAYGEVINRHPDCAAVSGQVIWVNEHDEWIGVSPLVTLDGDLMRHPTVTIGAHHPCNFASTVVARSAFERVGGFDATFAHANDWEMWTRLSTAGPVGWVAEPHSYYRRHAASDSARVQRSSAYITETLRVIEINVARLDDPIARTRVRAAARTVLSDYALGNAACHLAQGRNRAAVRDACWGVRVRTNLSTIGRGGDTAVRAAAAILQARLPQVARGDRPKRRPSDDWCD